MRELTIDIGDVPIQLSTTDADLVSLLEHRYAKFLSPQRPPAIRFEVTVVPQGALPGDADVSVATRDGRWHMARGDFRAEWDMHSRRGWIQQTLNPYSADSVLRIVHTLVMSGRGGFLQHAASAVRNGRACLFTGRSGAGKTTIARLAPADVTLLTDEISYVRKVDGEYRAFGTPFAGELGEAGEPCSAPLAAIFQLDRGNNILTPLSHRDAIRAVMQNVLFFSGDAAATADVFDTVCDCVASVPVQRLAFVPDGRVWEMLT